jgi:hypothetical protein
VEAWTEQVMADFIRSPCVRPTCGGLEQAMQMRGHGVEARFVAEPLIKLGNEIVYGFAVGRMMVVGHMHQQATFRHELTHILIHELQLMPWGNAPHHAWMAQCL